MPATYLRNRHSIRHVLPKTPGSPRCRDTASVQGSVQRRPAKTQHVHGKHDGIRPSTRIGNKLDNHRISSLLLRRRSGPKNKFLPPSVGRRIKRILSRNYGVIFRNGNAGLFPDYCRATLPSARACESSISRKVLIAAAEGTPAERRRRHGADVRD